MPLERVSTRDQFAGAPNTPFEKRIRGTAQSFGTDLPSLLRLDARTAFAMFLQGSADTALQRVGAHPYAVSYRDLARTWRKAKNLQAQQDVQPVN
jgi:hypothetical protein